MISASGDFDCIYQIRDSFVKSFLTSNRAEQSTPCRETCKNISGWSKFEESKTEIFLMKYPGFFPIPAGGKAEEWCGLKPAADRHHGACFFLVVLEKLRILQKQPGRILKVFYSIRLTLTGSKNCDICHAIVLQHTSKGIKNLWPIIPKKRPVRPRKHR